jgi:peptidoglycan hydrolase-like protein with peptidoglycan-binding domain
MRRRCETFRTMRRRVMPLLIVAAISLALPGPALGGPSPRVAALQAALWQRGFYRGDVNGVMTPATIKAVKRLQFKVGLMADGIVGPKTRPFLGRLRGPLLGKRALRPGLVGGDVVELQFLLAEHGFPCALFDGAMGKHTVAALRHFQAFAGLEPDGLVGPGTLAALAKPPPQAPAAVLAWPVSAPLSSPFGPRGNRFHAGIDLAVATGTPVLAVADGKVVFAGPGSNFGLLVVIEHSSGLSTYYAHLSRTDVSAGQQIASGRQIGLSGATGEATGPNLHFELHLNGAAVDPLPALR